MKPTASQSPLVPPPPEQGSSTFAEVSIRTMASDLDILAKSGGSAPTGMALTVSLSRIARGGSMEVSLIEGGVTRNISAEKRTSPAAGWMALILLGLAALFFVGYYLVPLFIAPPAPTEPSGGPSQPARGSLPTP